MEDRDKQVKDLRPELPHLETSKEITEIESFQNSVLRPILKFQHEILLAFLTEQVVNKFKIDITRIHRNDLVLKVKNELSNNQSLRNQSIGSIIGFFTRDEYQTFLTNETEYRRRIVAMMVERFMSTVGLESK